MARYRLEFKERVLARLLRPESSPVEEVSNKIGISVATMERWRAEFLARASVGAAASLDAWKRDAVAGLGELGEENPTAQQEHHRVKELERRKRTGCSVSDSK
jgi:transposase-like protein